MTDDFFDGDWELKEVRGSNGKDVDVDVSVSFSGFSVSESGRSGPSTDSPTTTPGPTAPTTPGEALGFPENDERFMQSLEVRGKNGHEEPVETVYALVLKDGSSPHLVALDDPEMYSNATKRSVKYYVDPMAKEVARQCAGSTPDAVVKIHTHPSGSTTPSSADKQGTETTMRVFQDKLGSRNFEFLQGIHGYKSTTASPNEMRDPITAGNRVSWHGERYQHTLALFDGHFSDTREVTLV